jgi:hypothetical protein
VALLVGDPGPKRVTRFGAATYSIPVEPTGAGNVERMATRRKREEAMWDAPSADVEMGETRLIGPAGEIRRAEVVRPRAGESHDAPTLRRLQAEGRSTRATGSLLDLAVKGSVTGHPLSDKLAKLRRD